jgi:hypothetical protein
MSTQMRLVEAQLEIGNGLMPISASCAARVNKKYSSASTWLVPGWVKPPLGVSVSQFR